MPDNTHTEIELKLRLLDPDAWETILGAPVVADQAGPLQHEKLESCYFDTADKALQKAGIAYRIRFEGDQWVATVKAGGSSAGGLHQRKEWNAIVPGPEPNIEQFNDSEPGSLLAQAIGDNPLVPLFCTAFDRRKTEIHTPDGSQIELAIDIGSILAGESQASIEEVELELKTGDPTTVLALGAELARVTPLTVEPRSKYFRGLCLAGLEKNQLPVETACHVIWTDNTVHALNQLVISQIHRVFTDQESFLTHPDNGEILHQFRIGLRRLRAYLSFAKPLLEPEGYIKWQQELRAFGHTMNRLRDTDVLLTAWQDATGENGVILSTPPWLGVLLQAERAKLLDELATPLRKGQYTSLLLGLWAWLADQAFQPATEVIPLFDFSVQRLSVWIDNMRTICKETLPNSAVQLHSLRIFAKKLRYNLEALPFRNNKSKLLLARLKRLQDCLGQLRDTQIMADDLDEWMNSHASRILHRDAGVLLGWTAYASHNARQNLERDWRRFKRSARRWLHDHE